PHGRLSSQTGNVVRPSVAPRVPLPGLGWTTPAEAAASWPADRDADRQPGQSSGYRGWTKIKNRAYWRYEVEREGAMNSRRSRQFVFYASSYRANSLSQRAIAQAWW